MKRWQLVTVAVLTLLPIALFAGFGAWSLYQSGHWFWLWWTMPLCWSVSSLLWRRWQRPWELPLPDLDRTHWTPQDQAATKLIEAEQQRVGEYTAAQLTDPQFYTTMTQALSLKIAQHYHPKAKDPVASLSVVELLTAVQLISADVEDWFIKSVPGSHLITVGQWKMLGHAPAWWKTASNAGWVASIVMNPLNLGRYLVSRFAVEPLAGQVQQQLLGAFYTLYLRQAGYYLIELNSGRLRGGSQHYREWLARVERRTPEASPVVSTTATTVTPAALPEPVTITVAIIGQVKAGKSSLVNALLGERTAATDILPATKSVRRYDYTNAAHSERFVLLDTPGYSDAGTTALERQELHAAIQQADLVLLVLDARSPAREADRAALAELTEWSRQQPRLKPPAVLAVVNKIDGLSPVLEWAPPYDWETPGRPKEKSIAGALDYVREVFGSLIRTAIPTCCDRDRQRVWGLAEGLIPAMADALDSSRAAALLRELHATQDRRQYRQMVGQLWEAGQQLKALVKGDPPTAPGA
jgi:small GTP-binding protein